MAEKPLAQIRLGAVQGSVWANNHGKYPSLSVAVSKTYKTKAGEYKTTNNYDVNDLFKLQEVARQCHLWILMKGRAALDEWAKAQEPQQNDSPADVPNDNEIPF